MDKDKKEYTFIAGVQVAYKTKAAEAAKEKIEKDLKAGFTVGWWVVAKRT